ncbi:MAG: zinc ribbon domain-containing protein [Anaerolineae bacterium]|nr:zinc ribbon domain-containing protein [Anaerolineae bacterium]
MTTCPKCGTTLRSGARFCQKCGTPVPFDVEQPAISDVSCPHCGEILRSGARFCQKCGEEIIPAQTCPNCGAPLRPGTRFCAKCGTASQPLSQTNLCPHCAAPIRAGAHFCRKCGAVLPGFAPLPTYVAAPATAPSYAAASTPPPPTRTKPDSQFVYHTGELLPTQVIAQRYVIIEKIAQGGMGAIYKAQDKRLQGKEVALKEMSEAAIVPYEKEKVLESFTREAQLLASLNHPNLVRVTDRFQEGERHYMVMEFIEGKTLERLLEQQPGGFSEERVLSWAGQLCDVLSYLHNQPQPIIYRDIKPANIMVVASSDDVKLIDFGIARFFKPGQSKDTIQFGTEGYAPPEQYGKSQTDVCADVYALGVTLHELLTHHDPATQPFKYPPVRQLSPGVSKHVESAIAKAVELNKDHRFKSMAEMWEALSGEKPHWFHLSGATPQVRSSLPSGVSADIPDQTPSAVVVVDLSAGASIVPVVQFGRMTTGGTRLAHCEMALPPGEDTRLSTDADWVQVNPSTIDQAGGKVTVSLSGTHVLKPGRLQVRGGRFKNWVGWHTSHLIPTEREYQSYIVVERQNGPETRVPVSVTVFPSAWQVAAGWAFTVATIVMELGVPLYVILALLAG